MSWFFFHDKSSILPFSNTEIVLFAIQLIYMQRIDMNVLCLVTYYGKVMLNARCGLSVIFCGFIWLLIGHETINIQKIFSQTGVHGFIGKTVIGHAKWHGYLKTKS